jgi:hypothetical protein
LPIWTTLRSALQIGKLTSLLGSIFSALAANGLAINLEKCIFAISTLELLGHMISAAGLAPTAEHTTQSTLVPPLRMSSQCKDFSAWQTITAIFLHAVPAFCSK